MCSCRSDRFKRSCVTAVVVVYGDAVVVALVFAIVFVHDDAIAVGNKDGMNEAHQENFCQRQLQEKSFLLKFLQGQTNKSFTRKKNNLRIFLVEKNSCLIFYLA